MHMRKEIFFCGDSSSISGEFLLSKITAPATKMDHPLLYTQNGWPRYVNSARGNAGENTLRYVICQ